MERSRRGDGVGSEEEGMGIGNGRSGEGEEGEVEGSAGGREGWRYGNEGGLKGRDEKCDVGRYYFMVDSPLEFNGCLIQLLGTGGPAKPDHGWVAEYWVPVPFQPLLSLGIWASGAKQNVSRTYTHMCVRMYAHMHAYTDTQVHICTDRHTRTHAHARTHARTHAHTHTHTHTQCAHKLTLRQTHIRCLVGTIIMYNSCTIHVEHVFS